MFCDFTIHLLIFFFYEETAIHDKIKLEFTSGRVAKEVSKLRVPKERKLWCKDMFNWFFLLVRQ
jgi:hypothetical protein